MVLTALLMSPACGGRPGVRPLPRRPLSRRPQQLGVSRATFDAATRGLEPDLSLPDLVIPGRPDRQPAQAEFVQTPGAIPERESRSTRSPRRGAAGASSIARRLPQIEQRFGVPGADRAGDLGARDRLRRREDAARRDPRARDAGVSRAAQGAVPRGVPARAEDAAGRPRHARRHALVLGRRDGAAAASARPASTNTRSISTATAGATSGLRCRTCSAPSPTIWSSSAGSAASAGPTRCARRATSTARSRSRP